jgi:hypothetical protein
MGFVLRFEIPYQSVAYQITPENWGIPENIETNVTQASEKIC